MKCIPALAILALASFAADYQVALPGYRYEFPRDHFNHPGFRTEWWYYTGNLRTAAGRRFGFELTFFRQAVSRPPKRTSAWEMDDLYLAHLALSDVNGGRFLHMERLNRAGPGIAGADHKTARIWNGNWEVRWEKDAQHLQAVTEQFTLRLSMVSKKSPVINGRNGVSQKGPGRGQASHYISLTRLVTKGSLVLEGEKYELAGKSWMDHEFFTHQLAPEQTGWDWLSLQFDNGSELMLYRLRRKDGSVDPYSAGTYIDAAGRSRYLGAGDFQLEPGETWTSSATGAHYPVRWKIRVPSLALELKTQTPLKSQELVSRNEISPTYWEGAIDLKGNMLGKTVTGVGYLEMTGYNKDVNLSGGI